MKTLRQITAGALIAGAATLAFGAVAGNANAAEGGPSTQCPAGQHLRGIGGGGPHGGAEHWFCVPGTIKVNAPTA